MARADAPARCPGPATACCSRCPPPTLLASCLLARLPHGPLAHNRNLRTPLHSSCKMPSRPDSLPIPCPLHASSQGCHSVHQQPDPDHTAELLPALRAVMLHVPQALASSRWACGAHPCASGTLLHTSPPRTPCSIRPSHRASAPASGAALAPHVGKLVKAKFACVASTKR